MAKEIPWFKFDVTEWMTGNIVYESLEVQGLFINICSLYWKNLGVLEEKTIEERFRKKSIISKISGKYYTVTDGYISIEFLDEQLEDKKIVSITNKINGGKGGRPKLIPSGMVRFYLIKCFNEYESFYKAGITSQLINRRFSTSDGVSSKMPYSYSVLIDSIVLGDTGIYLEKFIENKFKKHFPKISFKGNTECYEVNESIIKEVNEIIINPKKPNGFNSVKNEKPKKSNIEVEVEVEKDIYTPKEFLKKVLLEEKWFMAIRSQTAGQYQSNEHLLKLLDEFAGLRQHEPFNDDRHRYHSFVRFVKAKFEESKPPIQKDQVKVIPKSRTARD